MKYIHKNSLGVWGMISLTLILNIIIISSSNKNQDLLWLLMVSIPLFIIAAYFAWQTGQLFKKNFGKVLPSAQLTHFKSLPASVYPARLTSADLKVKIGNDQCSQPYNACILNIGSMKNADEEYAFIDPPKRALENSVSETLKTCYLAAGGVIWQIGSCYTGCRTENGHFNSMIFKKIAREPEVKMIELKLASAKIKNYSVDSVLGFAKPPNSKMDNCIFSGSEFNNFSDAEGMIHFLGNLRELSGGKPIGIRIGINDKKDFYKICYAVQKSQIIPDFIVVEGPVETTGMVHSSQTIYAGMPLYEALLFVSQTLQVYGLENKIRIIADGRIISCFDILKVIALGADVICTELPCYSIINNPGDELSLRFKNQNVYDFHDDLMNDTVQIMKICRFRSARDITLSKFFSLLDGMHSKDFSAVDGPVLYPGPVKKVYNSIINSLN